MPQRKPVINNKYHDTVLLLKGYRGAKIAVQESAMDHKEQLQEELGLDKNVDEMDVERYLEILAEIGTDYSKAKLDSHARTIFRTQKILNTIDEATTKLRNMSEDGQVLYLVLYYLYLSKDIIKNKDDRIERLRQHEIHYSERHYDRCRERAIEKLSELLWGYETRELKATLESFNKIVDKKSTKQR